MTGAGAGAGGGAAAPFGELGVAFGVSMDALIACSLTEPTTSSLATGPFVPRAARVAFAFATATAFVATVLVALLFGALMPKSPSTAAQKKDWSRCSQDYADALKLDQAAMSHDALVESYECDYQLEQRLEAKPR